MPQQPQNLTKKQYEAIRLLTTSPSLTDKEVAELVGVSNVTLSVWKKAPCFKEEMERQLHEIFNDGARKALNTMLKLVEKGDYKAAAYILDNAGYKLPDKVDVNADVNEVISVSIKEDDIS